MVCVRMCLLVYFGYGKIYLKTEFVFSHVTGLKMLGFGWDRAFKIWALTSIELVTLLVGILTKRLGSRYSLHAVLKLQYSNRIDVCKQNCFVVEKQTL